MSKIEKALQKAKTLEGTPVMGATLVNEPTEAPAASTQAMEIQPYGHEITAMSEPWALSVADLAETRIVYPSMEDRRAAEAFRAIRTSVMQACHSGNCVVLVTSITENGGASFVARNLAAAFAFDESKTALLVDCRLRAPAHQYLVSSQTQFGLTDYLEAEDVKVDEIVHPVGIPRFRLVPAGRRSMLSTEYLDSQKMRALITHLKSRYPDRYIVLDVAAISESPDARVLAEVSDLILLVVPYGRATESQIWNAAKSVDEGKFLGVVFNDEPEAPLSLWN